MSNATISPLKAVQGDRIREVRFNDLVQPVRGRSPRKPVPINISRDRFLSSTTYSSSIPGITNLKHILIPTKPRYIPQSQRTQAQPTQQSGHAAGLICDRWRKVIISRFILANESIVFKTGTKFGGVVTKDRFEVPLAEILDHVTPTELERFENEDFLAEDRREEEKARLDALKPPKKKPGRPIGWRKDAPFAYGDATSRQVSAMPPPIKTFQPPQGGHPGLAVVVPSFNGPKPSQEKRATIQTLSVRASSESSSAQSEVDLPSKVPAYSMMQASGLAPVEQSQDELTSRDQSADELGPSPKRRKVSNGLSYIDTVSPLVQPYKSPQARGLLRQSSSPSQSPLSHLRDTPLERRKAVVNRRRSNEELEDVDIIAMDDVEAEREALLRQFLPISTRGSTQSSDTFSDSLNGAESSLPQHMHAHPGQRAQNSIPEVAIHSHPSRPARRTPRTVSPSFTPTMVVPAGPSLNSHQENRSAQISIPPAKTVSSSKIGPKRFSMTPHFPYGSWVSPSKRLDGPVDPRLNSSSTSTNDSRLTRVTKGAKPGFSGPVRHKAFSEPRPVSVSFAESSTAKNIRKLGPQHIPNTTNITAYFAPYSQRPNSAEAPILKTAPTAINDSVSPEKPPPQTRLSSTTQQDSESESDDPLSNSTKVKPAQSTDTKSLREVEDSTSQESQSPSSDSLSSQVLVVHRSKQNLSVPDGLEDYGYHGIQRQNQEKSVAHNDQDEISLVGSTYNASSSRNLPNLPSIPIAPQLRGGQYLEDDEPEEGQDAEDEESSSSDSCSLEVLVVRR